MAYDESSYNMCLDEDTESDNDTIPYSHSNISYDSYPDDHTFYSSTDNVACSSDDTFHSDDTSASYSDVAHSKGRRSHRQAIISTSESSGNDDSDHENSIIVQENKDRVSETATSGAIRVLPYSLSSDDSSVVTRRPGRGMTLSDDDYAPTQEMSFATTSSDDEESSQEILYGLHKEQHLRPKRIKRPCPLPGCQSKQSFVRLANHIRDFHKIKDIAERKMWLAKAKRNDEISNKEKKIPSKNEKDKSYWKTAKKGKGKSFNIKRNAKQQNEKIKQPPVTNKEFDYGLFQRYLQGIAGGNRSQETARSISRDVQLFFEFTPHSSTMPASEILLNRKNLENFYHVLKERMQYKPTTVAEKLRRVKMAIQFLLHECYTDSSSKNDAEMYLKGSRLTDLLTQWTKSLSKAIAVQRQRHGLRMSDAVRDTADPYDFLENTKVLKKINTAKQNLQTSFYPADIQLITAYAAALIVYKNAQRSGVIQNLTIEEFEMRKHQGTKFVICCINHKTGAQGRAKLVVNQEDMCHLLDYKSLVRDHLIPNHECNHLFFLTQNGAKYTQVYRKIVESIRANHMNITIPPPPSSHRILVATEAASSMQCDLARRKVNKHMCHSDHTSEVYYEFANTKEAMEAYSQIQKLAKETRYYNH